MRQPSSSTRTSMRACASSLTTRRRQTKARAATKINTRIQRMPSQSFSAKSLSLQGSTQTFRLGCAKTLSLLPSRLRAWQTISLLSKSFAISFNLKRISKRLTKYCKATNMKRAKKASFHRSSNLCSPAFRRLSYQKASSTDSKYGTKGTWECLLLRYRSRT